MSNLAAFPPSELALWQLEKMGTDVRADLPVVIHNIVTAESLGQLHLDMEDGRCTGVVGWVRLTMENLATVAQHGVRGFWPADDTPHAPVCFLVEQLNTQPGQLQQRMRWLAALPGVEILAGWRGDRLRVHRVRGVRQ